MLLEKMHYLKIIQTVITSLFVTLKLLLAKPESGRTMHTKMPTFLVSYHMIPKVTQNFKNKNKLTARNHPTARNHILEVEDKKNNF